MKRFWLNGITILSLLLFSVWLSGFAAAQVTLSFPTLGADPGDALELPLSISDAGGLMAANLYFTYDPAVLQLNEVVLGDLPQGWFMSHNSISGGSYTAQLAGTTGLPSDSGSLIVLHFTVLNVVLGTQTTLEIDYEEGETSLYDVNSQEIAFVTQDGSLQVGEERPADLNITSPGENDPMRSSFNITGTVDVSDMQSWIIDVAPGYRPTSGYIPLRIGGSTDIINDSSLLTTPWNSALFSDGQYTIRLRASRTNLTSVFFYRTIWVDNTLPAAPSLTIASPAGYGEFVKSGDTITITGSAEPGSEFQWATLKDETDGDIQDVASDLSVAIGTGYVSGQAVLVSTSVASATLHATVHDPAGNISPVGMSNSLTIDNEAPVARFVNMSGTFYTNQMPIEALIEATDGVSGVKVVQVRVTGNNWQDATLESDGLWHFTFNAIIPDYIYNFETRAIDRVDNYQQEEDYDLVEVQYYEQMPAAWIQEPFEGFDLATIRSATVSGIVANNLSDLPGFNWSLKYRHESSDWIELASGTEQILSGTLALWNHNYEIAPGTCTLRLTSSNSIHTVTDECYLVNNLVAPSTPELVSPLDQAAGVPNSPLLIWDPSDKASKYKVSVYSFEYLGKSLPKTYNDEFQYQDEDENHRNDHIILPLSKLYHFEKTHEVNEN